MNLDLGKYWLEITLSYGIVIVLLTVLVTVSWFVSRQNLVKLRQLEQNTDED